jgi:sterol desaturase/sphingolipid hydroxylase (fatty acid hydroxylase superfamily)
MTVKLKQVTPASKSSTSSSKTSTNPRNVVGEKKLRAGYLEGFAGTTNGSFFSAPSWVDLSKAPGTTSQDKLYAANPDWYSLLSGKFLLFSPNLIWLLAALIIYFVFPYPYNNIPIAKKFSFDWIGYRAIVNILSVLTFFGFWHITLYFMEYGQRPFKADRQYRLSKVVHNVYYSILGALQWTIWEVVVLHCYATGRLGFVSDKESFSSWYGILKFISWFFLVPIWREVHFYFAHRLIHNKVLYKYVHSLHHRNTDIEPFSGLSMHPIEHLYYFACIGPSLYVHATPFAFLWNGIHLLLSPAASHSGYEDNWQSDQFHYLHHRYFECNYGTTTFPFDRLFGTFRDQLIESTPSKKDAPRTTTTYKGAAEIVSNEAAMNTDAKATLYGMPKWDQQVFNILSVCVVPWIVYQAKFEKYQMSIASFDIMYNNTIIINGSQMLSFMVAFGPILIASFLLILTSNRKTSIRKVLLYPFHREKLIGSYGINVFISTLIAVVPVYHLFHTFLSLPGDSIYHTIHTLVYS